MMNGLTLSSSCEPASIPAAIKEDKSVGMDASSLMARARILFLPSFRALTIRSALAASVAIAMTRRGMGATLILVWMDVLARMRGVQAVEGSWEDRSNIGGSEDVAGNVLVNL